MNRLQASLPLVTTLALLSLPVTADEQTVTEAPEWAVQAMQKQDKRKARGSQDRAAAESDRKAAVSKAAIEKVTVNKVERAEPLRAKESAWYCTPTASRAGRC